MSDIVYILKQEKEKEPFFNPARRKYLNFYGTTRSKNVKNEVFDELVIEEKGV